MKYAFCMLQVWGQLHLLTMEGLCPLALRRTLLTAGMPSTLQCPCDSIVFRERIPSLITTNATLSLLFKFVPEVHAPNESRKKLRVKKIQ